MSLARAMVNSTSSAFSKISRQLVGTRSCPYSLTSDTNFLVAPHSEHDGVWLFGGGSGHGFKHGPALAEYVEGLLEGREEPEPAFALGARPTGGGLRAPWIEQDALR